jgi:hypothetical protein
MFDLTCYSIAVAAIVILMFGVVGVALVVIWFALVILAWERTR